MAARLMPRYISPALRDTAALVHSMLVELQMPAELEAFVLAAVMESRFSRPTQLKQFVAVMQTARFDTAHFFARTLTPQFLIQLLDDLALEGLLTRTQATQAQNAALAVVDKDGQWKEA